MGSRNNEWSSPFSTEEGGVIRDSEESCAFFLASASVVDSKGGGADSSSLGSGSGVRDAIPGHFPNVPKLSGTFRGWGFDVLQGHVYSECGSSSY